MTLPSRRSARRKWLQCNAVPSTPTPRHGGRHAAAARWWPPSPAPSADRRSTGDGPRSAARSAPAPPGRPARGTSARSVPATAPRRTPHRARCQTLGQRRRQILADRLAVDVQCLIDLHLGSAGVPMPEHLHEVSHVPRSPRHSRPLPGPLAGHLNGANLSSTRTPPDTPQGGELRDGGWGIT